MKCIECDIDNKLKDREANSGRCKSCGHPFAFEPTAMNPIKFTDPFFAKVLLKISANNTLFFTEEQFFYFLEKRLRRQNIVAPWVGWLISGLIIAIFVPLLRWVVGIPLAIFSLWRGTNSQKISLENRKVIAGSLIFLGVCLVIIAILLLLVTSTAIDFLRFALCTILGMSSIYLGIIQGKRTQKIVQILATIQPDRAREWLTRWIEVNGSLEKLLPPPKIEQTPAEISNEISNYSFDRALICDSDEIAQFLIANNFHFEHNCAVLSVTGYPQSIFATVMQMLRRNPDLKVFSLHNATPQGVILPHTLRSQSEWFADTTATVYDLGITPKQILKQPEISVFRSENLAEEAQNLPSEIKAQLSSEEIEWLEAGNYIELASFSPAKLLRIVTRGIANASIGDRELSESGDSGNWSDEDTSYIYISDSFG
ncbi:MULTISPECIES: hypothetical protein [Spirulina sp. CCY15215]|uniref:hypothetical protein n=1 Tax=Spirulina sp. CCY15215 TaxID=2767591 RepID=UPI00195150EE|nr:hypothetical protein [Spirulina major]